MTLLQIWDEYTSDILFNSLITKGTRKDSKTNQNKGDSKEQPNTQVHQKGGLKFA